MDENNDEKIEESAVDNFNEDNDEVPLDEQDYSFEDDDTEEELFKENPLKAIWFKLNDIEDKLDGN